MVKHIYLVGFMGSGKSTVGRLLATRLSRPFHDLDDLIEKEQQMSIPEIFALRGEAYFRKVESRLLLQTSQFPPGVIALGGGTYSSELNRSVVEDNGISVWLRISFPLAEERCRGISSRPLTKDPIRFHSLFQLREQHYALTRLHVDVEDKPPERIADEIAEKLPAALITI
jgi:shikimate kinase